MERLTERLLDAEQALAAGEEVVGGKALGLARLQAEGAQVADWFAVPVPHFLRHLKRAGLLETLRHGGDRIRRITGETEQRRAAGEWGDRLRREIESTPLDDALRTRLEAGLGQLGDCEVAVRSSMAGEDGASRSFAGQLESFLFQSGLDRVERSLRRCWGSAFSCRALLYRLHAGLPLDDIRMAVVVQRMIEGRVSGVLFTANPVNGRRDECLLTAVWGVGEALVSGACDSDELVVSHSGEELSARVASKDARTVRGEDGTVLEEVPAPQRRSRCLTREEAARICREGVRVAAAFGSPQDIEWTLEGERLVLLQSRPITSLPEAENRAGPVRVWDNSNIQESYCGVTTPLTFSFASEAYASVYTQTFRMLGVSARSLEARRDTLRNLLGLVRGRVYYNIENWYRLLLLLPSFRRNKADMEQMMGLEEPVDFVEDEKLGLAEMIQRAPRIFYTLYRLLRRFGRLPRSVPAFIERFESVWQEVHRRPVAEADFSRLMELIRYVWDRLLASWETPIVNDFRVMMAMGRLRRLVGRAGVENPSATVNDLIGGERGIESTRPTELLMSLAATAREDPSLKQCLGDGSGRQALARVRARHPDFAARLDAFLDRYGDRTIGELKLETITMRQDPGLLIDTLRSYLKRPDLVAGLLGKGQRARRTEAEKRLESLLGPLSRRRLRKTVRSARAAVRDRESMRLCRTRTFGLFREIYLALGQRLQEAGRLGSARDVLYLTVDEIEAYDEGRSICTELARLAGVRRSEFRSYQEQDLPCRFVTRGPVYYGNRYHHPSASAYDPQSATLRGIGCCPGVVEGRARLVLAPSQGLSLDGEILLAVRTDPGWTPLFPTASALLVERGSTLSHSAVVAREFGLPTVVGIPGLTRIVQDGERLRVDGAEGTVERLEEAP